MSRSGPGNRADLIQQDGVVMITILVFLTLISLGAALEFPSLLGQEYRARQGVGERRVQDLARGAEEVYRLTGQYPADLGSLIKLGNYARGDHRDPYVPALDLVYQNQGDRMDLRSRGLDGVLSSKDDVVDTRNNRQPGRSMTRNRLRLLRAHAYRSDYLSPTRLTTAERLEVRDRLRIRSLFMRRRVYLTTTDAKLLDKVIKVEETALKKLIKKARKGKTYTKATGRNGLLGYLGLPDSMGTDGFGRDLLADDFGFYCAGRDGRKKSNDDF